MYANATPPEPDHFCPVLAVNLLEDERKSLASILFGSKWLVTEVQTCQEAIDLSSSQPVRVVLCEPQMPDGTWDTLLEKMHEAVVPPALVVVSRLADERLWVEVLNLGGYDVLLTPFDRSEVLRVLFLACMANQRQADRTSGGQTPRLIAGPSVPHGLKSLGAAGGFFEGEL